MAAGFLFELGVSLGWGEVRPLRRLGGGEDRPNRPPGKIVLNRELRRLFDLLTTEAILADVAPPGRPPAPHRGPARPPSHHPLVPFGCQWIVLTVTNARVSVADRFIIRMTGSGSMRRESLVASIVGELVMEVVTGRFREGMTLPAEPQLCERFEVSRTVVREAMVRLAHMGLVVIRQGRGTVVRARADWNELDPELLRIRAKLGLIGDLVEDLLAIRRLVEIEVAGNAALRRTDADLAQLARLLDRLYATMDDPTAYTEADIAFHEALIAANGNELLRQMMRPVNQIRRIGSIITASRDHGILAASMAGHQAIYDAVTAGDAIGAREAMASHLGQFERDISEALTTAGPQHLDALGTGAALGASR